MSQDVPEAAARNLETMYGRMLVSRHFFHLRCISVYFTDLKSFSTVCVVIYLSLLNNMFSPFFAQCS